MILPPIDTAMLMGKVEARRLDETQLKWVYCPVGAASEQNDITVPYDFIRCFTETTNILPVLVGPEAMTVYPMVLHEQTAGWDGLTQEMSGYHLLTAMSFEEAWEQRERFVAAMLGGGRAPEYIRDNESLRLQIADLMEKNAPVASTCHGVELLAASFYNGGTGDCVLKGRKIATVTKCRRDVDPVGGIYVDDPAVVDGNLHSWKTYHQAPIGLAAWFEAVKNAI